MGSVVELLSRVFSREAPADDGLLVAARAAAGFVGRLAGDHPEALIAIDVTAAPDTRRGKILESVVVMARDLPQPMRVIATNDLLSAFAEPSVRTREAVRDIVRGIFAHVDRVEEPEVADALAVGAAAYCQSMLAPDPGHTI